MKKNGILNLLLSMFILLSNILTPQLVQAVSENISEDTETIEEASETDETDDTNEGVLEEDVNEEGDNGTGDAAEEEVADAESESEPAENEQAPVEDDAVADSTPEDINNNDPPVEEEIEEVEEEVKEEVTEEVEEDTNEVITSFSIVPFQSKDLGNIFTFNTFTVNGQKITDDSIIDISAGSEVELAYAWDTTGLDAKANDTASIAIPDAFKQVNITNQPLVTAGINVGTYSIQNGILEFVFNENIESGSVQNGIAGLNLSFDLEKFQENIKQEIEFNDKANTSLTVIARPTGNISGISKKGQADRDRDAREITWTVEVMNDSDEMISEAVLKDVLQEGLGSPRDFVITELSVGLNGNKKEGETVEITPEVAGNEFSIDFENIAPFSGYRVQYKTTIEDYSISSFKNDAVFSYGGKDLPANSTVDVSSRSNPIEKSGEYNWGTNQIDWLIIVNKSGGEIADAEVRDILPAEQTLIPGSIKVQKTDSNGQNRDDVSLDSTEFPVELGKVGTNDIYEIRFSSSIDWTKVNDGEYQWYNEFTNKTELFDGNIKTGEDTGTVEHWRSSLLEKTGASNVNYENKTLTWTIDVNKAKHPLTNVVVTDYIPAGLSIEKSGIFIDGNVADEDLISITPVTSEDNNGKTEVKITLGDIGTETVQIKYTTTIEDFKANAFKNTASLTGDGIGKDMPTSGDEVKPPANSFGKSFEGIDYNAKTMDWKLTVNPIRENIKELEIVDTFPNKGLILLPKTLVVKVAGEDASLDEGADYTLTPNTVDSETGYQKGFTIELNDSVLPLGNQLEVTYQTSYDPQFEVDGKFLDPHTNAEGQARKYINNAQFIGTTVNENTFDIDRKAETTLRLDSWNSGKKEGQLVRQEGDDLVNGWVSGSERKIAWQLYTNYQQQNLGTGVVIEDTLEYEGTIDEGSVVVSVYEVDANGNTTITDAVLDEDNYTVDYDGKSFTLTFKDDFVVEERYVVTFTTTVPNISQPSYTNKATVTGEGDPYPYSGTVTYDKHDHFLRKGDNVEGNQVFTGEEIDWEITLNESLSTILKNVEIVDTISSGLVYVEDSLEISTGSGSVLKEGLDYRINIEVNDNDETVLSINLLDDLTEILVLSYKTVVTETNGEVSNSVSFVGTGITNKTVTSDKLTAKEFSWVSGDFSPNRGAIQVTKQDAEVKKTIEGNEATFILEFELNGERLQFGGEFTTQNGMLEIGNLPLRTYYLSEVNAPTGYILSEQEIEINVDKAYGTAKHVFEVDFENTRAKTDRSVLKKWDDGDNQDGTRTDSVSVQLLANGVELGEVITLSDENDWTHSWKDLYTHEMNGTEIIYTVEETTYPEVYTPVIEEADGVFTIVNTYTPETIDVSVQKEWNDAENQDGVRPKNVTVNLLNGSKIETSVVLNENNGWKHTFPDLPKYSNGEEINYSISENTVAGYSTAINTTATDEEGFISVITNTYTPEKTSAKATKLWDDADNQDGIRPETVSVQLLANGTASGDPVVLSETNNWSTTWNGLALNAGGEEIAYTVEEIEAPAGYNVTYDNENRGNLMITNSYEPAIIDIPVSKEWVDLNNQDGVRPNNVTVNLLADGEIERTAVLNKANDWSHVFSGLPVNANGNEINYTLTENSVSGYSTEIEVDPDVENGVIITNSRTPDKTSVTATKRWEDSNNQDGNRPTSIQVQLTADGEKVGEPVTLTSGTWTHTWTDLDENSNGQAIKYSVVELDVDNEYTTTINDADQGNIIITNSYEPELIDVPVLKNWDDANNQDGKRPANITLNLLNGKGEIVKQAIVQAQDSNKWEYVFTNVPKYENGIEIEYSVTESSVSDYSTSYDENPAVENGLIITNHLTPAKTSVTVTKGWNDANNQDGNRPGSVEVQLYANDEAVGDPVELKATENWTYTWSELDANSEGAAIKYTVVEKNVPERYKVSVNDRDHGNIILTNNYSPELIEIPVVKIWDDANNQDGVRPGRVTIELYADDVYKTTVNLNENNNWSYTFKNLPKYDDGVEIKYTFEENIVNNTAGYELTSNGVNNGVFEFVNSRTPETIEINGTKTWDDANNQDGIRPNSITVNLVHADGTVQDSVVVEADADGNWSYEFVNVPVYQPGKVGHLAVYSVMEVDVPTGYESVISDIVDGEVSIANTHEPELMNISGNKIWDDANNQDGIRPESITVKLLHEDGTEQARLEVEADADGNWTYEFIDIPVYQPGKEGHLAVYSVVEDVVPEGYDAEGGNVVDGEVTLTNTHIPEVITISGDKIWDDADNQDGKRPEEITVRLFANGVEVDSVPVTADDNWSYEFVDVPKFAAGSEIAYTVLEDREEAYTTVYEVVPDGYNITNKYEPLKTNVTVLKNWNDNNYVDARPESLTIKLFADGVDTGKVVELNAENNWFGNFVELDMYAAGEIIDYTVEEAEVPNGFVYDSTELTSTGFVINNKPAKVSVGDYVWIDVNKDGLQDDTDIPLENVVLIIVDKDGNPVTDVYGNLVKPTTTDEEGYYIFENLPIDSTYTVKIDRVASAEILKGLAPTKETEDNREKDSSTWEATSDEMVTDQQHDPTLDFGFIIERVSVGDYVWIDVNRDGLQDETDIPLAGVTLILKDDEGNVVTEDVDGNPIEPQVTDENGYYTFDNLPSDRRYIVEIDKEAFEKDFPDLIPTIEGENNGSGSNDSSIWTAESIYLDEDGERDPTLDFGFVRKRVSVGDYVWIDVNRDGLQDDSDIPLAGVELTIVDSNGDPVKDVFGNDVGSTITDENGWYTFDNLPADQTYTVRINKEAFEKDFPDLMPTLEEVGEDNQIDSSLWETTSRELTEDLERDPTLDFGFLRKRVSVGDYVWLDKDKDGIQDEGEPGIPGVVLEITDEDGNPVTDVFGNPVGPTTTDENGYYTFDNLPINNKYIVTINREASKEALKDLVPTLENAGDRAIDSSLWRAISEFLDEDGQRDPTLDFGFVLPEVPEEPEEPSAPEEPTEPEEPTKPEKPTDPQDSEGEDGETKYPQTGEAETYTMLALTLVLIGLGLHFSTKRRTDQ